MDTLYTLLQREYDIVPRTLESVRSAIKVTTDRGTFALKRYSYSTEKLLFIYQTLHYLRLSGYRSVVPFVPTRSGHAFVEADSGVYYVVPWVVGQTGNALLLKDENITAIFAQLGKLHRLGTQRQRALPSSLFEEGVLLQAKWNKQIERLQTFRAVALAHSTRSPTDEVFLAHADHLFEMAIAATGRFEEWLAKQRDIANSSTAALRLTFCHGRPSLDHAVYGETPHFISFDDASIDVAARDLAYLLRDLGARLGERMAVEQWITHYAAEHPLSSAEVEILSISLHYPSPIIRFLERYYAGEYRHVWPDSKAAQSLERRIALQQLLLRI